MVERYCYPSSVHERRRRAWDPSLLPPSRREPFLRWRARWDRWKVVLLLAVAAITLLVALGTVVNSVPLPAQSSFISPISPRHPR